ncbi:MAG TPA: PilZ domain-containing protein [Vicinamibacteria bacterium]|nr:PilZ domain-containing protein [Vicinamibacteria bacterium]
MSMQERRRSPRVAVDLPVRLRLGPDSFPGRLRDICRDAALVEVHHACELGAEVSLSFELPEQEGALEVKGRVLRLAAGDGDARAVAILFTDLHPAVEGRIAMFLHQQD